MLCDLPITAQPYALGVIVACILWGACAVGWCGFGPIEKRKDK